jgi:DNA-binding NtrC family response regulator
VEPPALTPAVRAELQAHTWPGNVRELRHAVERALLLSDPGTLDPAQLTPATEGASVAGPVGKLEDIIRAAVQAAIHDSGGNRTLAARRLGISRQRLLRIFGWVAGDDS